jgi:hypothetical protein
MVVIVSSGPDAAGVILVGGFALVPDLGRPVGTDERLPSRSVRTTASGGRTESVRTTGWRVHNRVAERVVNPCTGHEFRTRSATRFCSHP